MPPRAAPEPERLPAGPPGFGAGVAAGVVLVLAAFAVAYPALGVAIELARGAIGDPAGAIDALRVPVGVLARSSATAVGIGVLATALAWGPARVLASGRRALAPVLIAPMLMPMTLAYAGWGQARAPGTAVGDWLEHLAGEGHRWAPMVAGRSLAVVGLALWAVPIAAIVLAGDMARRDRSVEEAARLERASVGRRALLRLGLARAGVAWAVGAVALVMLGSAVPLHLAQLETHAIVTWRELAERGPDGWWRVWIGAWPALAVALVGGWFVGGWFVGGRVLAGLRDTGGAGVVTEPPRARRGATIAALAVWAAAVAAPLAMFAWTLDGWSRVGTFLRLSGDALGASVGVGFLVALGVVVLALATSLALGAGGRWSAVAVGVSGRAMLAAALVPGVLVGAAVARCGYGGAAALVAAHLARFGVIGVGVGCWVAWAEPPERRALRRLDAPSAARAWLGGCLPVQAAPIAGAGLAAWALSVHEIEASIMVQPAGVPSLAQTVLGMLHYARTLELAAASVVVMGGGLAVALAASALLIFGGGQPRRTGRSIR